MTTVSTTYLPITDPLCSNETCLAFAAGEAASQAHISWASQFEYGKYVTYYYCAFIGLFALAYGYRLLKDHIFSFPPKQISNTTPSISDKAIALGRSLAYRRLHGSLADTLALPSFGISALIILSFLYACLLTFTQRPYYRERRDFGSPPLGIRAGMAGTAMTPLVFALAGKYNLVTLLTGVSHEKLNVLHRWVSYIYLFFGIAHTVPFLIADSRAIDGGSKGLSYRFSAPGSMEYTGIAPFVVLVFLCAASAYWLRRRFYYLFAKAHILASLAFLGTMFWHCANTLDSWYYLWATLAIMVLQWGIRAFGKTTIFEMNGTGEGWKRAGEVRLEVLEGGMCKVRMDVAMKWRPGQHVFLRLPEFGMLANHPFTIASCFQEGRKDGWSEMVFFIRPHAGVTRMIIDYEGPGLYGMLDGPYGGITRPIHMVYDNVVLVGGGGGVSALLPWLDDLSLRMSRDAHAVRLSHLSFVWCIRDASVLGWIETELRSCVARLPVEAISVVIFVTGQADRSANSPNRTPEDPEKLGKMMEQVADHERQKSRVRVQHLRPYLPDILRDGIRGGRTLYFGCGPEGMKIDLSNFAAAAQRRVLEGKCAEIALHTETFDW